MQHVMLDIETLGTNSYAPILSIGAVKFDPNDGLPNNGSRSRDRWECFHVGIELDSCLRRGLKPDAKTIEWWFDPARADAREAMIKLEKVDILAALDGFESWIIPGTCIWGNGSDFDNVILANAYKVCDRDTPWDFRHNRCFRTFKSLALDIMLSRHPGVYHSALDDAKFQVEWFWAIREKLGITF